MAAPAEINIGNLAGQWILNKQLSDPTEPVLVLQGIGWMTRKAIGLATITLHVKQYVDENNVNHIDIEQTATGGIKGTTELRELDNLERTHEDHVFGKLKGRTLWVDLDNLDEDPYQKEGWLEGEEEKGGPKGERFVQSYVENEKNGWVANQIWGFALVDGQRRYVRKVVVKKGKEVLKIRMVYDWAGK